MLPLTLLFVTVNFVTCTHFNFALRKASRLLLSLLLLLLMPSGLLPFPLSLRLALSVARFYPLLFLNVSLPRPYLLRFLSPQPLLLVVLAELRLLFCWFYVCLGSLHYSCYCVLS